MKKQQDYELMSHSEIARMREELAKLRGEVPSSAMSVSMEDLSDSIQEMTKLFKAATEGMQDENTAEDLKEQFKPIEEKIDAVIDQNHKIADAILTVVDLVNKFVVDAKKQQDEMNHAVNQLKQPKSAAPFMPPMPPMPVHDDKRHAPPPPPPPPRQQQMPPLKPLQHGMPPPSMPAPPKKKRSLFEAFK